jgi:hypothetical protein
MRKADAQTRFAARRKVYTHLSMLDALLDDARILQLSPWKRLWFSLPSLARKILR